MALYRVISADLRTGTRIAELNVTGLSYGSRLNNCGDLSGTVALPALTSAGNAGVAAQINSAVDEGRRQIIVERDGVVVWSGICWLAPYNDDPPSRDIRAAEDWSYFRHRVISSTQTFTGVDQLTIAQNLIDYATGRTTDPGGPGDVGVTVESSASGVTRDRVYNNYELKPVAEAVEQLSQVDNGFDFAIDAAWDSATGGLVKTFRTSYPRRGSGYQTTGHVFEVGRNVIDWNWPTDGTIMGNKVWAVGRGEGSAMLISSQSDVSQIQKIADGGPGYPLLETTVSVSDVSVQSTLDALAVAKLKSSATPVTLPEITVKADVDPIFGSYITGDSCRFIVPPNVSPRFPTGLDTFLRIVGWDVSVSDDGSESVKLILGAEFNG
jgi:hypothetical protein